MSKVSQNNYLKHIEDHLTAFFNTFHIPMKAYPTKPLQADLMVRQYF